APYNNTPYYTLSAFGVNDSNCPSIAMSQENGCITFHANADGKAWPALLQILSIISSGGIQEAGWYTAQGADVPGFVCNSAKVDAPCLLPGDTSTTNASAYQNFVTTSKTASTGPANLYMWDTEITADLDYPTPVESVAFKEVGSGPYYLDYANPGVGYTLVANPYYQAPTGCAGQIGCLPLPSRYVQKVITYWTTTDTEGIQEFETGYADAFSLESPELSMVSGLVQDDQAGESTIPMLATGNFGFNTQIDLSLLATIDSSPPHPINIPANAFAYVGLRAALEYGYPYATVQAPLNVVDGLDMGNPFGGFVPPSAATFYASSGALPNYNTTTHQFSDPVPGASEGTARWYWNEAYNDTGGPYYDPQLARFSAAQPLYIPVLGFTSAPNINAAEAAWGQSVAEITGGVVQFQQFFEATSIPNCLVLPCGYPWPIWWFDWIPDYPSPTQSWQDAYGPGGLWGDADSLSQTFVSGSYGGTFASPTCGHTVDTLANLTFWATYADNVIPQVCQGVAINVTIFFANAASYGANLTLDHQYWDLVQEVYNNLELTVGADQPNTLFVYAPWVAPESINAGALIGGASEWCYYALTGNGLY
ncbi:MAG TPA: hypothetical protein VEH28_00880, partial [Thermoplasmata archaeon]|nr:hypothetical protein [Thermoplasmata archaeon]